MEGYNIYHRKDGRWEGRIYEGKTENGGRKYQAFFGKSAEAVMEKLEALRPTRNYQLCLRTVKEVFEEWSQGIRHRVKESTLANYLMKWEKHLLDYFGDTAISTITPTNIYEFIAEKQTAGLSNRYVTDILVLLKSIFKYAAITYNIKNIMTGITMPKKKAPEIAMLDENQLKRLQELFSANKSHLALGMALASVTGMRIGEVCALQWRDFDLEKRVVTVSKTIQRIRTAKGENGRKTKIIITEPKSESSKRVIPLPDCIIEFLKEFMGNPDDYLCSGTSKPVEPRKMQRHFVKLLKSAELPHIHFHALRHMFATKCVKLGFDIKSLSELLGHSNIKITLEKYVHPDFSQKQELMKRIQGAF